MKRTFLERIFSGYEVQRWAEMNNMTIVRLRFNRKGALVYTLPKR